MLYFNHIIHNIIIKHTFLVCFSELICVEFLINIYIIFIKHLSVVYGDKLFSRLNRLRLNCAERF